MMVMSESDDAATHREPLLTQADMGPERQSGRKAQTANIVAAKVGTSQVKRIGCDADRLDRRRRHQDVSRPKGDAEDDPGSYGWYSVSPLS